MQDDHWRRNFALLEKHGMSWDMRIPWWHLEEGAEVARSFPGIPMVVNHTGLPLDRSEEGLAIWRDLSDEWGLAYALEGFALLFSARSPERAVRLVAAATAARERVGIRPLPGRETNLQEMLRACALSLGDEPYAAAWSAGRAGGLEAALEDVQC